MSGRAAGELPHVYPGGLLIIDEYEHWQGARWAVDEHFRTRPIRPNRIDYTGRVAVKLAGG